MTEVRDVGSLLYSGEPGRTAVILPESETRVTYDHLRAQAVEMAEILAGAGVSRNTRVATVFQNGLPAVVSFLAASIAGTAAPLNPAFRYHEFCFYLKEIKPRVVLCPENGAEEARQAAEKENIPVLSLGMRDNGWVSLRNTTKRASLPEPGSGDTALLLHTSGSTGRPKRVPLKHASLVRSSSNIASNYRLCCEDVTLCVMPLFHVHGLIGSMLSTFRSGGAVCLPEKFNPSTLWRVAGQHQVSWYSAVPTLHQLLLARMGGQKRPPGTNALRFVRSCSAALSPSLMEALENALDVPVVEAYGMTEAAHQICSNPLPPQKRKPRSVGRATGIELGIVDEQGIHLQPGSTGEIVLRGPTVIDGYETESSEPRSQAFAGDWFRTGDQGILDEDGFLFINGRIKELINRGGEKVAPVEVEEVLLGHPSISEAAVFAVPDSLWGEEVHAAVVLREPESPELLLDYCRDRLAEFKCPKRIRVVSEIPRTATGKIQRTTLGAVLQDR
jgi:acyl-CoA synthetase (AMP-forming)/AMP-acid ligase II